ncbi:MDR family NADP-dependent oxidoreductase [Actinokineospora iranica]|uniref:Enoyl reductase (ER) domain-containing protein n=1 Tax=Actinokineospora iranica TaxID=1271860 RepID=A0A1G6Q4R7_9PSEU|nr:NADP-dependent oxidoreductase [Actinokineospora iranica]SDC87329.1 hypothetical protein SAMN05216174_10590 [Actinokineospora iranica]
MTHREIHLIARPEDTPKAEHFAVVEVPVPEPGPGQVLVRNRLMSVTAVMGTLVLGEADLPVPPAALGAPLWAPTIGEVVAGDGGNPGDLVVHDQGWREYALVDAAAARHVGDELPDPAAHLSQGVIAWLGVRAAEVRAGDTVFVTGAAGGVGSMVAQFARLAGAARVIGSTGSPAKGRRLVAEHGYDAVVLRGGGPIEDQLRAAAPEGIDAVFDNVGGEQLTAALSIARQGARVALVGALSTQLSGGFSAPVEIDTGHLILRGITLRGMPASDHLDSIPTALRAFGDGLRSGAVTFPHTRFTGIEQAPRALIELLGGRHFGSVLVEL